MSARVMRIAGDRRLPDVRSGVTDAQRRAIDAAHLTGTETVIRFEADDDVQPPTGFEGHDMTGAPMRIAPLNYFKRLPVYEHLARDEGLPVRAVWTMLFETHLGAVVPDARGRPSIMLATDQLRCPLLRIGTYAHEAEHVRRGDYKPKPYAPFREADAREAEDACGAAADRELATYGAVVNQRATVAIDPRECVACYHGSCTPCRQGDAVFEQVNTILGVF